MSIRYTTQFILLALLFFPKAVLAEIKAIQCDNPSGARLDYGKEGLVESTDKFPFGTEYIFKFDSNSSNQVMHTLKRPNTDSYTGEALIILHNNAQLTLIERYPRSAWMYSIFPELGIGYFTVHKDGTKGGKATSTTMTAKCHSL